MEQTRMLGEARAVASSLSAAVRRVDLLDRTETVRKNDRRWLAEAILDLEAARKGLRRPRVMKDERFALWTSEVEILQAEVDARLKRYLQTVPEPTLLTRGITAWARAVLKGQSAPRPDAKKPATGERAARETVGICKTCKKPNQALNQARECRVCQAARHTSAPKGKTASRAGTCVDCRKRSDYITTSGRCTPCTDKLVARR